MSTSPRPSVSIVTGGAGFIAVTLIGRLLAEGRRVVAADNLSRGCLAHLDAYMAHANFRFVRANLADRSECAEVFVHADAFGSTDEVWHLAANSDIPAGVADATVDLRDTFLTTFEILEAMKLHGVRALHFASSSAVYGDHADLALSETTGPTLPISNYGAMKLASEGQASAAREQHLDTANLFRFPNVVGVPATHGVLLDFVRKLKARPHELEVLGDGTQQKAYLHVDDLVDAMVLIRSSPSTQGANVVNIGPVDEGVSVRWIAERVVARASRGAVIRYGTGNKGWVGDVPRFRYATNKLQALGWRPTLNSAGAVDRAIEEICIQEGAVPLP